MEVSCGVYISKVDALHPNQSGWVTIKKNDVVCIPDMCLHRKPTIALHRTSNDVGFVNLEHFEVARNESGERVNTVMAHAIAVRDSDHTSPGNWLSYSVGHLILLSPGPWEKGVESYYDATGGPFLKVFNLTTVEVGFIRFMDFYWFPNAEVITEKEILIYYADQGKYAGDRPMMSRAGDKLVVIWVSKTAPSVSKEQMFHGVRTSTGTVGWWKGLRRIEKAQQQTMRAAIEEEAQRRMPAGSNLQDLVKQWGAQRGSRGAVQTPGLDLNNQHAGVGIRAHSNHVPGAVPAQPAGFGTLSRPPNLNSVEHPLHQRSHLLQMPVYPYNITPPNVYPVMANAQHPPRLGPPGFSSNMPETIGQEDKEFGPYDSPPKWNWPPGLIEYLEELKRCIDNPEPEVTGEEIVKCPWRKVREYEEDLEVGIRLISVKKCDVENRWGLNCWGGVIVSSSGEKKPIIIPSRVVGAVDKFDETRDAQIYDMALVRGGPCGKHPVHDKSLRCCISYTGPHPKAETCVLKDRDYVSRTHMCCCEDWMVVGERFDSGSRPVIVACDIGTATMYGTVGIGRSSSTV